MSIVTKTIEIAGKFFQIRCQESELSSLQQAVEYLNNRMAEVKDSGSTMNVERVAIITALNITHQFLQLDQQKTSLVDKVNNRLIQLQDKLDHAINRTQQTELELIYSFE